MKHLFAIVVLVATSIAANAQINKGNQSIGLSFSSRNSNYTVSGVNVYTSDQSNFSVNIDYAYFIKDKVSLGLFAGFGKNDARYDNSSNGTDQNSKNYTAGVFGKQYFMFGNKFGAFGAANLSTTIAKSHNYDANASLLLSNYKYFNVGLGLQGGIAFFPFKRLSCEAGIGAVNIGYSKNKSFNSNDELDSDSSVSLFDFSFAKSLDNIMFTLRYHFGFKK
ncbi:autotransporter outer membrane beta-barrel domain-containing protein [Solitalea lacus]|uniref:autotransporter outer membrane beta-barrel domain-containing protein n=1 Tax=Solitalea lacus TaxID=2911172 RepID=UPI001EDB711C|nr:autotransporter outer membrane beta-barrel domain-containing protein [Solitalea lacus]UKJ08826.1 autotransporter outer membrane beta-barrel domain-containing protein [Solitalea lacus]